MWLSLGWRLIARNSFGCCSRHWMSCSREPRRALNCFTTTSDQTLLAFADRLILRPPLISWCQWWRDLISLIEVVTSTSLSPTSSIIIPTSLSASLTTTFSILFFVLRGTSCPLTSRASTCHLTSPRPSQTRWTLPPALWDLHRHPRRCLCGCQATSVWKALRERFIVEWWFLTPMTRRRRWTSLMRLVRLSWTLSPSTNKFSSEEWETSFESTINKREDLFLFPAYITEHTSVSHLSYYLSSLLFSFFFSSLLFLLLLFPLLFLWSILSLFCCVNWFLSFFFPYKFCTSSTASFFIRRADTHTSYDALTPRLFSFHWHMT